MQIPIPPVNQCNRTHKARPDQEKKAGTNASRAPTCIAPIQIREGQLNRSGAGSAEVVVVMINLWSCSSRIIDQGRRREGGHISKPDGRRQLVRLCGGVSEGPLCNARRRTLSSAVAIRPKWFNSLRAVNQARHPSSKTNPLKLDISSSENRFAAPIFLP
jgi:hypothetical protein